MILKQLGYNNFKVLLGGYHYFTTGPLDIYDMPDVPAYLVEEPAYDYLGIMETMGSMSGNSNASSDQPEVVIPARKKKSSAVEGGC